MIKLTYTCITDDPTYIYSTNHRTYICITNDPIYVYVTDDPTYICSTRGLQGG